MGTAKGLRAHRRLPVAEPIIADLRMLPYDQRVAVILASYAGLPPVQIAKILKRPVGDVLLLARQARAALAAGHPARMSDEAITQELKDAIPHVMRESHDSADDLAHGRWLSHRRWIQRGSAALVAVVLVVVAVGLLVPTRPPVPQAAPSLPVSTPSGRAAIHRARHAGRRSCSTWRSKMAEVTSSYLDPSGKYFSGFGYRYDSRYDMPSFWTGKGRARLRDVPARQGRHRGLCAGRDEPQVRRTLRCHYRSEVHVHQIHGRQLVPDDRFDVGGWGIEVHALPKGRRSNRHRPQHPAR